MNRLLAIAAVALALWSAPARAQNSTCPTAPIGTSNNQCASTAFVQNQIGVGAILAVGSSVITGGTNPYILYNNNGVLGNLPITGMAGNVVLSIAPTITGHPTIEGVTSTGASGTGNFIFGTSPSISGLTVTGSFTATGLVTNTDLANPSLTVTATSPLTGGGAVALGASTSIGCQAASGSQAGCLSAADWTTFNGKQASGNYITALTGDGTASGPGSVVFTLATVNAGPGSVGSSTAIPVLTTNGKGLVTAQSTAAVIAPAGTLSGTTLNSTVVNSSLTSVGTLGNTVFGGTITAASLSTVGTIAGSVCQTSAGLVLYEVGVNCFAASAASITVGTTTVASGTANALFFQSGASPTGTINQLSVVNGAVLNTSSSGVPSLTVTPVLGVAGTSAGTIGFNNVTSGTLTIGTVTGALGTHTINLGIPSISTDTFAYLGSTNQLLAGGATVTPNNLTAATTFTVNCGLSPLQWIVNSGNFTVNPPTAANSQNCAIRIINGTTAANAGTVSLGNGWSGKTSISAFSTTPTVSAASVSFTNTSATIGWTVNTPTINSIVFFANSGGALPTNFAAATLYYVIASTASTSIQVSATPGGSAITAGSAGTGTQTGYVPSIFDLVVENINSPPFLQLVGVQ